MNQHALPSEFCFLMAIHTALTRPWNCRPARRAPPRKKKLNTTNIGGLRPAWSPSPAHVSKPQPQRQQSELEHEKLGGIEDDDGNSGERRTLTDETVPVRYYAGGTRPTKNPVGTGNLHYQF
jgi:hypothetical protein